MFYASAPKAATGPLIDEARVVGDFGDSAVLDMPMPPDSPTTAGALKEKYIASAPICWPS